MYSTVIKRTGGKEGEEKLDLVWTFGLGTVALWQKNECLQIPVPVWSITLFNLKLKAIYFFVLSLLFFPPLSPSLAMGTGFFRLM